MKTQYRLLPACLILTLLLISTIARAGDNILRAGVASMITPISAAKYYQQVVSYLGEHLGRQGEMINRTTYDEIDRMLENNKLDVAFICAAPYVLDHKKFGVELLVAPVVNGAAMYRSYIIAHRRSKIGSFEGLRDHSFVFVDPKSNSGRLYPLYWLQQNKLQADNFFSRYLFSYSHNKSVEMVAKHKVDGAAVDSVVYDYMLANDNPYVKETKILHRSPSFGIPPIVVPQSLPLFFKEKMREILLNMHKDPQGKEILAAMRIDRFVTVPDSNYDQIRVMLQALNHAENGIDRKKVKTPALANKVINFTVTPRDNPRMAYDRYQPLIDYLTDTTGYIFELLLKKNFQDTVNSIGSGEAWFGILGPLTYLDAHARYNTRVIARSKTGDGNPYYRSVIIAGQDGKIDQVEQLSGKKFAFAALWSTSGNLIPRYILAKHGIHLDSLQSYHNYNYHDTVVKEVVSGAYDAGAVRKTIADKYKPLGLKILAVSEPIPTGPVVIYPGTPDEIVRKVEQAFLNMAGNAKGRQVLGRLDFDMQGGFIAASDADYSGIRQLINDVPVTCGTGCHPKTTF